MTVPPTQLQPDVAYFVHKLADALGISPDSVSTMDLQALAYGLRIAAAQHPDRSEQFLADANAIDDLSNLDPEDITYLMGLSTS